MSPTSTVHSILFSQRSLIRYGENIFSNVPVLLQVDGVPLIETIPNNDISWTTQFSIYHNDGTKLAEVVGARLFLTHAGEKAGVEVKFRSRLTYCTIGDTILFEVLRVAAASMVITTELYSPSGMLVRSNGEVPFATFAPDGRQIAFSPFKDKRIRNTPVGFSVTDSGRKISLGEK